MSQGAVVVLDAASGAVRAMVGGRDYRRQPVQPRGAGAPAAGLGVQTVRLAGGDGERALRPDDTVLDAPIRHRQLEPARISSAAFLGEITLEEALAQSINTASVRLLLRAGGPRAVAAMAQRCGIADRLPDNASMALGTGEVGLLELAAAYAPFFNGGRRVGRSGGGGHRRGATAAAAITPPEQAIDPDLAADMARMLATVVSRGTGRDAAIAGRAVAGKTGTTQDSRDAWFIGWTNGEIIGVWLGNDDGAPMKDVMGGSLPAKLFHEIAIGID